MKTPSPIPPKPRAYSGPKPANPYAVSEFDTLKRLDRARVRATAEALANAHAVINAVNRTKEGQNLLPKIVDKLWPRTISAISAAATGKK